MATASSPAPSPSPSAHRLGALRARWHALAPRERQLVTVAAALVAVALLWWVALRPAWTAVRTLPAELARLDAQRQQMQRLADEARALRAAPGAPAGPAAPALKAATDDLGDSARLIIAGDRATLTVNGASGDDVREWLQAARETARARPVELTLARGADGALRGSVVVALPAGGPP